MRYIDTHRTKVDKLQLVGHFDQDVHCRLTYRLVKLTQVAGVSYLHSLGKIHADLRGSHLRHITLSHPELF